MNETIERKQPLDKTILLAEIERIRLLVLNDPYKQDICLWLDHCKKEAERVDTDISKLDNLAVELQRMSDELRNRGAQQRQHNHENRPFTERFANTLSGEMDR